MGTQKAMAAILHSICNKYVEIKYSQPKAVGAAMQTPSSTTNSDVGGCGVGMLNCNNINSELYGLANASSVWIVGMEFSEMGNIWFCETF